MSDTNVPDAVATKAAEITQNASTVLAAARAIEHYLSTNGFYLNENTQFSRPGVRADRLERMLSEDGDLIGDDQQYSALMALMLHQLGINAPRRAGFFADWHPLHRPLNRDFRIPRRVTIIVF